MTVDRRALLQALGALAVLPMSGCALAPSTGAAPSAAALGPEAFARLCAALAGYPTVDADASQRMLAAFATPQRRATLARLAQTVADHPGAGMDAAIRAQGLDAIANELVGAWYSGVVSRPGGADLVLYTDALVWAAMGYVGPMGQCRGETGQWARAPQ